jgi:acyl dehydratase
MAGKYFEEFRVGEVFTHQPGRTVTEMDNVLFTCLSMNPQPLHLDEEFAKQTEFGARLVNSILTLGILVGLSVGDTTLGTTVANLGFEKTEFPKPVFHGDTLYAETEVMDKRESRSRPDAGLVFFEHRAKNQRGDLVARCRRTALMKKKGESNDAIGQK